MKSGVATSIRTNRPRASTVVLGLVTTGLFALMIWLVTFTLLRVTDSHTLRIFPYRDLIIKAEGGDLRLEHAYEPPASADEPLVRPMYTYFEYPPLMVRVRRLEYLRVINRPLPPNATFPLPQNFQIQTKYCFAAPWTVCLAVLAPMTLAGSAILGQRLFRYRTQLASSHACKSCGYDLRATPDRCPECGSATANTEGPFRELGRNA